MFLKLFYLFQMVDWVHRNSEIVKKFQGFLLDLLSAHNYYTKSALEKLMPVFKSGLFLLCNRQSILKLIH
jgi:hypothetical protein